MRLLITAGPTQEPLDPVRYLSNRSSGKMGYALAAEARRRGHAVRLISGPVSLKPPRGVELIRVRTAEEMLAAVRRNLAWCRALIMAAAVADWRPAVVRRNKIKAKGRCLTLRLRPTPDILSAVRPLKGRRIVVGFAAETTALKDSAREKLQRKGLDLIVANDVTRPGAGFEVDTNQVTLISRQGVEEDLPLMSKRAVARRILAWIEERAASRASRAVPGVRLVQSQAEKPAGTPKGRSSAGRGEAPGPACVADGGPSGDGSSRGGVSPRLTSRATASGRL